MQVKKELRTIPTQCRARGGGVVMQRLSQVKKKSQTLPRRTPAPLARKYKVSFLSGQPLRHASCMCHALLFANARRLLAILFPLLQVDEQCWKI
jgi:hypothetical protein